MQAKIFFITGVPGSGKTTIIEPLRSFLGSGFDVHDFDERGVPDNVTPHWAKGETKHWQQTTALNAQKDIHTVVSGFALPENVNKDDGAVFVLLDLNEKDLAERLLGRYHNKPENVKDLHRATAKTPQQFLEGQIRSIPWLRSMCKEYGAKIIDTSGLTPTEVVKEVGEYIQSQIA